MSRYKRVIKELTELISDITKIDKKDLLVNQNLIELGADSIILSELNSSIHKKFDVSIPLTLYFSTLTTIEEISAYINEKLKDDYFEPQNAEPMPIHKEEAFKSVKNIVSQKIGQAQNNAVLTKEADSFINLFSRQLQIMDRQISLLTQKDHYEGESSQLSEGIQDEEDLQYICESNKEEQLYPCKKENTETYLPYKPIDLEKKQIDENQENHIKLLMERYTKKTSRSKQFISSYRKTYADCRNIAGFRPAIKEMVYQLVFRESKGSHIVDIDGNDYIDLAMDFGVSLFGHNAAFIVNAISEELKKGFPLSLISELSGEVSDLICEFSGADRVSFFNSGTEAVMVALRLSKAVTGKNKIVIFAGAYHGTYDGILGMHLAGGNQGEAVPLANGITQSLLQDLIILDYGEEESIRYIEKNAGDIAAVLIEPVQSRRPDFQPIEFLKELRMISEQKKIIYIFDEMILGFRLGKGGAQEYFGIKADLITYGKIVGGGMPIGVVAGKEYIMNSIDGGIWNYGDDSLPPDEDKRTFIAGTFCHHPLAMAAAKAVLLKIKELDTAIYQKLEENTKYLADSLNNYFIENEVPIKITRCGSLFRFLLKGNLEMFYYHMIDKGVYIWEGRNCFLSLAHTKEDIDKVIHAVKETCDELEPDFFSKSSKNKKEYHDKEFESHSEIPLTEEQERMLLALRSSYDNTAFYESVTMEIQGELELEFVHQAVKGLVERHDALCYTVDSQGGFLKLQERFATDKLIELVKSEQEISHTFNLEQGPLFKIYIIKPEHGNGSKLRICMKAHHIIIDGWSMSVITQELIEIYNSLKENSPLKLKHVRSFWEYTNYLNTCSKNESREESIKFWGNCLKGMDRVLNLPQKERVTVSDHETSGNRYQIINEELPPKIRKLAMDKKCSPYILYLSAFQIMLKLVSRQENFAVWVPVANEQLFLPDVLVGNCTQVLPLTAELCNKKEWNALIENNKLSFDQFSKINNVIPEEIKNSLEYALPEINVVFNMDRVPRQQEFAGTSTKLLPDSINYVIYDLFYNLLEIGGNLVLSIDYKTGLYSSALIGRWADLYFSVLEQLCERDIVTLDQIIGYTKEDEEVTQSAGHLINLDLIKNKTNISLEDYGISGTEYSFCIKDRFGKKMVTGSFGNLYIGANCLEVFNTGWIARLLENGVLDLFGPEEKCVMIRGYWFSLWRIENQILTNEKVSYTEVRRDSSSDTIYCFLLLQESMVHNEFIEWCRQNLDNRMLPNRFYLMKEERNTNIEDCILLEYENNQMTETEEKVFQIISLIIHSKEFGKHENLISLGINSLQMLQSISAIQETCWNIRIPLSALDESVSVAILASLIDRMRIEGKWMVQPIEALPECEFYETTSEQKRMYLLHEKLPKSTNYNLPAIIRVKGELSKEKIEQAINRSIEKHEVLRTNFKEVNGEIVQEIRHDRKALISYQDFSQNTKGMPTEEELCHSFVRPFDLKNDLLMRAQIIKLAYETYVILLDFHHIIFDGNSSFLLAKEMKAAYSGESIGEVQCQYKEYAAWKNKRMGEGLIISQEQFWMEQLGELPDSLDFPTDYLRSNDRSYKGMAVEQAVDRLAKEKINLWCKKQRITPFTFYFMAIAGVLNKYTRQDDFIIGTVVDGRNHYQLEETIGMFVNTLPIRIKIENGLCAEEFSKETFKNINECLSNAEVPFERLVELSRARTEKNRNPLFDILFSYQNMDSLAFHSDKIEFTYREVLPEECKFDIHFMILDMVDSTVLKIEFASELFTAETIHILAGHMIELIKDIIDNPKKSMGELSVLTEKERLCVVKEFNSTDSDTPNNATIPELFMRQVELHPNKVILTAGNGSLTYSQFNSQSNQIANGIIEAGVKNSDVVAVMLPRNSYLLCAIMGILKAGAAYLPIDSLYPKERIRYMVNDCNARYIVTTRELSASAGQIEKCLYIEDLCQYPAAGNPELTISGSDLCYVIYTSGSTGEPKGTMLTHSNAVNFCYENNNSVLEDILAIDDPAILSNTTILFDIHITETLFPLLNGIRIVLAEENQQNEQSGIAGLVQNENCNILQATPSKLKVFMADKSNLNYLNRLAVIILGGEVLLPAVYAELRKHTKAVIYNIYGPTEATVWVSTLKVTSECITIGKPIANTKLYILDHDNLCGIGMPGELCIAGKGVSKGYVNKEALTAEKFTENPVVKGERIYHSGDLARWLPDGNIQYLGRIDEQVKIRGYRIELGEIETVIRQLEEVSDAVVVVKENKNYDKQICAYIVSGKDISIQEMKDEIRSKMPDYMVPSHIMKIDKIPVTQNGKVNKKLLPEMEMNSEEMYIEPRSTMEKLLAPMVEDILGISRIGVYDDFFQIGGHSLLALKVINRIEEQMGVRLTLHFIFNNPTIEQIGKELEKYNKPKYEPIGKADANEFYPMSSSQKRLYFVSEIEKDEISYNMPALFELKPNTDLDKISNILAEIINRHEIFRTSFHIVDKKPVQKINECIDAFVTCKDRKAETSVLDYLKNFVKPFDLASAPLIRAEILKSDQKNYLLFDMHHIISDGTTIKLLLSEFLRLYDNETLAYPLLQYKDYSVWMAKRDLEQQKSFWMAQFKDEIPVLELPLDYVRGKTQSFAGAKLGAKIEKELKERILSLCKRTKTTEYMVFLAAYMVILSKYSGQEDIIVGTPVSGRMHKDTEEMMGMFVNSIAVRGKPQTGKSFEGFLKEIKETCVSAYENQEYPFEELIRSLKLERDLSRNPLFDVMFEYQEEDSINEYQNIMAPVEFDSGISKFDISILVIHTKNGYQLEAEYCSDLWKAESIHLFVNHYIEILNQISSEPGQKLNLINMVTKEERDLIDQKFNNTKVFYPKDKCIHQLFEQQVIKNPNKNILKAMDGFLSYGDLDESANRIANGLIQWGISQMI